MMACLWPGKLKRSLQTNNRRSKKFTLFPRSCHQRGPWSPCFRPTILLVSISNCLEETEKTERPPRTQSVKTNLHHTISHFSSRPHSDAKMQSPPGLHSLQLHCPVQAAAQWLLIHIATDADELGKGIKMHWLKFHFGSKLGPSEAGTIWNC